jgi:LAO/AO transport system kinase
LSRELAERALGGSRLALSRLLTLVENGTAEGRAALDWLYPHTGRAHRIGVTGAPGTGKSSLVNQMAHYFRLPRPDRQPLRVGVIAVDPSSPFSGGAILGDRVRMRELAGDPGVFIRSMASRGSLGGLAATTSGLVQVFDAAGFDLVMIETVGAGQAEVDIARLAHTTLVVEAPGLGDDIQAIKAGILEIADILVINKADRPGVENTERALQNMLQLAHPGPRTFLHHGRLEQVEAPPAPTSAGIWIPPVLRTVATESAGIEELGEAILRHRRHLEAAGEWDARERARLQAELEIMVRETLFGRWEAQLANGRLAAALDDLAGRRISPWQAVTQLTEGGVL